MSTALASHPARQVLAPQPQRSGLPAHRYVSSAHSVSLPQSAPQPHGLCFHWDMSSDLTEGDFIIIRERLRDSHRSAVWNKSLPEAETWAANLALGIVEILQGTRPLPQVRRWVLPQLYDELALARGCVNLDGVRPGRCSLMRWRTCAISERIVESCVVIQTRGRRRTVSIRIEEYRGRWIATALDIL